MYLVAMVLILQSQVLYTKLFIVMGISWIFECVHHLLHPDHTHQSSDLCYDSLELILRIIGCLNLLRGSLIFFIFVCKDSTLDKVALFSIYLTNFIERPLLLDRFPSSQCAESN